MSTLSIPWAAGAVAAVALGGCAAPVSGDDARPTTTRDDPAGSIVVTTTYRPGHGGIQYIEGAMAQVVLRDADGRRVDVRTRRPTTPITFTDLAPGRYVVSPALRPCDGNCGYLDPRIDGCSQSLEVSGTVHVRVDFVVGSRCRIHAL